MILLQGPQQQVRSLVFSPDETQLHVAHVTVGVHVWDLATRTCTGLDAEGVRVFGEFALTPCGRWAFARCPAPERRYGNDSRAIHLGTGQTQPSNFLGVVGQNIAISPSGEQVVTAGTSQYDTKHRAMTANVSRWYGWNLTLDGPTYAWDRDLPQDWWARSVAFVGNDQLIIVEDIPQGRTPVGSMDYSHRLSICSVNNCKPEVTLSYPETRIDQVLGCPTGRWAAARLGTTLWLWEAPNWDRPPRVIEGTPTRSVEPRAAIFHPSGQYLLRANNNPSVSVFDPENGKLVKKWKWEAGTLRAVAISPNAHLAAAAGTKGCVVVWDLDL